MNPTLVVHFRRRADNFYFAARDLAALTSQAQEYWQSVGLLAVHSCIACADAVLVALRGHPCNSENHKDVAQALRNYCSSSRLVASGIKHFEWLLDNKTKFSYGAKPVRDDELQKAKAKMDQFFAWASSAFPSVAQLQGPQTDA